MPAKNRIAGLFQEINVKTRLVAARLFHNSVIVNVVRDNETGLPNVIVSFMKTKNNRGNFMINLSRMTKDELETFEEILKLAIDLARPLSNHLDAYALAHEEELREDFESRLYRPLPTVVYGKGTLGEYSPELFVGCEDVLRKLGFRFGTTRRVPVEGGSMDERKPTDSEPEFTLPPVVFD